MCWVTGHRLLGGQQNLQRTGRGCRGIYQQPSTEAPCQRPCSEPLEKLLLIQLCMEPQPMLRFRGCHGSGSPCSSSGMWVTMPHSHGFPGKAPQLLGTFCLDVGLYVITVSCAFFSLSFFLHPVCFIQITFCWAALFRFWHSPCPCFSAGHW